MNWYIDLQYKDQIMVQLKRNETLASLLKEAKAETVKEVETETEEVEETEE